MNFESGLNMLVFDFTNVTHEKKSLLVLKFAFEHNIFNIIKILAFSHTLILNINLIMMKLRNDQNVSLF